MYRRWGSPVERCRIIETSISNCAGWLADAYAHGICDDGCDSLSDSSLSLSLRGGVPVSLSRPRPPYLRYWNQIVAGVRRAEAQYQRQSHARAEQTNFHLVLQVMRQVPCQNVEVEVQRDHCKLPVVTCAVRTAASSGQSQLCVPACLPDCLPVCLRAHCEGDSQGEPVWAGAARRRQGALFHRLSVKPPRSNTRQSVAPCWQQRWRAPRRGLFKACACGCALHNKTQPNHNEVGISKNTVGVLNT